MPFNATGHIYSRNSGFAGPSHKWAPPSKPRVALFLEQMCPLANECAFVSY